MIVWGTPFDDANGNELYSFNGIDDFVFALDGDDWIFSSSGNDWYFGGDGVDTVFYLFETAPVFINNTGAVIDGVAAFSAKIGGDIHRLISIEEFHGGSGDDTFHVGSKQGTKSWDRAGDDIVHASHGLGEDSGHRFLAGSGNDQYFGSIGGKDWVDYRDDGFDSWGTITQGVIVDLTAGTATDGWGFSDVLDGIENVTGTQFDDTLLGDANRNSLQGAAGNDLLDGGGGIDRAVYWSEPSGVYVDLAAGFAIDGSGDVDTLVNIENVHSSDFADILLGNSGRNELEGEAGDDLLIGRGGADILAGEAGNDTLNGGTGFDMVEYFDGPSGVFVDLGAGSVVDAWGDTDTLISIEGAHGSVFNDTITGSTQANLILGRSGDDLIMGNGGDDTVLGGAGADTIDGGTGNDRLTGGSYGDVFAFGDGFAVDTVTDYQDGIDHIDVSGWTTVTSFADLTVQSANGNVEIFQTGDPSNMIVLEGVLVGQIDSNDFIWV